MSLPYAPNCTHNGVTQPHLAEGYLISPTGRRITATCKEYAREVIDEYREKLGEEWTFEKVEWQQVDYNRLIYQQEQHTPESIPFYIDPVHSASHAASTLGRLGGKAKSPAKSISSRENGRKGGRPRNKDKSKETESVNEANLDLYGACNEPKP